MSEQSVSNVIQELTRSIRNKLDRLGFLEEEGGAFATGHLPSSGPHAYLCRFYEGLTDVGLEEAEAESERYLPVSYREFLKSHNGAHIVGISLHGATGGQNVRRVGGVGQPVSIRYQNVYYSRPAYIPDGHFGLGAMNGKWFSQGHLYLTSTGEVELINRDYNLIGARWPSFTDFLRQEVPRQLSRFDEAGAEVTAIEPLPGKTEDWEALGKEISDRRKKENTFLGKTIRKINSFRHK